MDRGMSRADIYSTGLRALGHTTADVMLNCEPAQLRWHREHLSWRHRSEWWGRVSRRPPLPSPSLGEVAIAQIEAFGADLLYVQDPCFFRPAELGRIRELGVRVCGQIASRLPDPEVLSGYELLVSSLPNLVERFREQGIWGEYMPLAFDRRVGDRLRDAGVDTSSGSERPIRVSFVGGVHPSIHPSRIELLESVSGAVGLELWGHGVEDLPADSPLHLHFGGHAWGIEGHRILAGSQIVVNAHSDVAGGYSNNMRLFEATGLGALLITEESENIENLFAPGTEVVTYGSAAELVRKVRYYRDRPDERRRIAAAGQARTLSEHTYEHRMPVLSRLLERGGLNGRRPQSMEPSLEAQG
jgi:spore maturation protein CgeB